MMSKISPLKCENIWHKLIFKLNNLHYSYVKIPLYRLCLLFSYEIWLNCREYFSYMFGGILRNIRFSILKIYLYILFA